MNTINPPTYKPHPPHTQTNLTPEKQPASQPARDRQAQRDQTCTERQTGTERKIKTTHVVSTAIRLAQCEQQSTCRNLYSV